MYDLILHKVPEGYMLYRVFITVMLSTVLCRLPLSLSLVLYLPLPVSFSGFSLSLLPLLLVAFTFFHAHHIELVSGKYAFKIP